MARSSRGTDRYTPKEYQDFKREDITLLVDMYPTEAPTRENIMKHMEKLVADAQPGDSLFLSCKNYSFPAEVVSLMLNAIS